MVQEAATEDQRGIFPSYSSKELLAMLTEHTSNYTDDGSMLPVRFNTSGSSHITEDGVIKINPVKAWEVKEENNLTEKQAVRVMLNTLSHEVGHYNHSELDSKKKFVENYPTHGKVAGAVVNILEDVYIDRNRTEKFKGLRRPHKWVRQYRDESGGFEIKKRMSLTDKAIRILAATSDTPDFNCPIEVEGQFLEDWTRKCEMELAKVPDTHSQGDRLTIAHRLTATLLQKVDDPEMDEKEEDMEDLLDETLKDLADRLKERATEHDEEMEHENIARHADEDVADETLEEEIVEDEETEESDDEDSKSASSKEEGHKCADGSKCQIADAIEDCHVHSKDKDEDEESKGVKRRSEGEPDSGTPSSEGENTADKVDIDRWVDTNPADDDTKIGIGSVDDIEREGLSEAQEDGVELSDDIIDVLEELGEQEDKTRTVNKAKGKKVDVNKVVRRKAGDKSETKIFEKEVDEEQDSEDTAVGITLDASGSMDGGGMKQGLTAIGALGKATKELDQDFTATTFWSDEGDPGTDTVPTGTTTLTEVGEDFSMNDLDEAKVRFLDPLALGVENTVEEMEDAEADNKLLFVVTDGDPTVLKDGSNAEGGTDEEIVEQCRTEVEKHRADDFDIIGVAVGKSPSEDTMSDIFGVDEWFRFEQENLAEKLLTVFRNTVDE